MDKKIVFYILISLLIIVILYKLSERHPRYMRHYKQSGKEHFDGTNPESDIPLDDNTPLTENKYKRASFKDGVRGGYSPAIDKFFENENPLKEDEMVVRPIEDSGTPLYEIPPEPNAKLSDEEKFNIAGLLPSDKNKGWFEDVQGEAIKNTYLINIHRPVGIDTVNSTLKNATYDSRGEPTITKNIVSPWLQSSIEPDNNIKIGALC